jgi:myo-inositol-1(or 4)-monophosphatase
MNDNDIFEFLVFLADQSAKITMKNFRQKLVTTNKNTSNYKIDPVTDADKNAENLIRRLIEEKYPDHSVVGEEFSSKDRDPRYRWYIDPIDGTKSFISGIPLWGTLIGLEIDGSPAFGIIDNPSTKERYIGSTSVSYKIFDGHKSIIRTSEQSNINDLKFGYTTEEMFDDDFTKKVLANVTQVVGMTRTGGDCYFYGLLASGYLDLIIENNLKPFDIIPIVPIIIGAGGFISDWNGHPEYKNGNIIVSNNSRNHQQILDIIEQVR